MVLQIQIYKIFFNYELYYILILFTCYVIIGYKIFVSHFDFALSLIIYLPYLIWIYGRTYPVHTRVSIPITFLSI